MAVCGLSLHQRSTESRNPRYQRTLFIQLIYSVVFLRYQAPANSVAPPFVYKPHTTHNSSIRPDEGLTLETSTFASLYGGQFTLSTQLIKPNYLIGEYGIYLCLQFYGPWLHFGLLTRTLSVFLQESISRFVEGKIIVDFRSSLSDVCDVLSSLDIAIGFLASSGGQAERPLKCYLHEVLKLPKERGLKSPTVSAMQSAETNQIIFLDRNGTRQKWNFCRSLILSHLYTNGSLLCIYFSAEF